MINDVIYSLLVLIEKLAFSNKQLYGFIISLSCNNCNNILFYILVTIFDFYFFHTVRRKKRLIISKTYILETPQI